MDEPTREGGTLICRVGPIALMCIAPDARDALDEACAQYEAFRGMTHDELLDRGIYQFAYWLFRYSGLVEPTDAAAQEATLRSEEPG